MLVFSLSWSQNTDLVKALILKASVILYVLSRFPCIDNSWQVCLSGTPWVLSATDRIPVLLSPALSALGHTFEKLALLTSNWLHSLVNVAKSIILQKLIFRNSSKNKMFYFVHIREDFLSMQASRRCREGRHGRELTGSREGICFWMLWLIPVWLENIVF